MESRAADKPLAASQVLTSGPVSRWRVQGQVAQVSWAGRVAGDRSLLGALCPDPQSSDSEGLKNCMVGTASSWLPLSCGHAAPSARTRTLRRAERGSSSPGVAARPSASRGGCGIRHCPAFACAHTWGSICHPPHLQLKKLRHRQVDAPYPAVGSPNLYPRPGQGPQPSLGTDTAPDLLPARPDVLLSSWGLGEKPPPLSARQEAAERP